MNRIMKKYFYLLLLPLCIAGCKVDSGDGNQTAVDPNKPDWYYTGGTLGTSYDETTTCFEQETPQVDNGWFESFKNGEDLFEKPFMENPTGIRGGLGPVYVRSSCLHCHPGYSHGKSVPEGSYDAKNPGNGTLLVIYDTQDESYVKWVAGMPQLFAVEPFKAPIDPNKIKVTWTKATCCAASANQFSFPDGEPFELFYPEVEMPIDAIYGYEKLQEMAANGDKNAASINHYAVKLENTIGIYGTGLTDAIPDDSITAQWAKEEQAHSAGYLKHWKTEWFEGGQWKTWYTNTIQGDGTKYVRRYTYAMSRGPILDAAGANAIWNITNVTRSDRRYHYLDLAGTFYAKLSSQDPDVQAGWPAYIQKLIAANPEYAKYNNADSTVESNIYNYLKAKDLPAEMTDNEYADLMVWHRGLAVPAARDVTSASVLRGKELFTQIGCAQCHRPCWTTGSDQLHDPAKFFKRNSDMPRYPYQKIWPYTDFVQHKLCMENDIRTGWCRTTPLWGKGLHQKATGDANQARMHDTRARNVIQAIMWHGYCEQSDAFESAYQFYHLPKADRDALVDFVNAI